MLDNINIEKLNKGFFSIALFITLIRKHIIYFFNKELLMENTLSLLLYASIGILMIQFLLNSKHSIKGLIFLIVSIILYLFTKEGSILVLTLMALSIETIDNKYVVKSYLVIHIALLIFCMVTVWLLPELGQHQQVHYRIVDGVKIARYNFGAGNPNFIFLILLPVYAAYIYLRFNEYNAFDRLLIIISLIVVYINTYSRTGLLAMIVGLLLVEIIRLIKIKEDNIFGKLISVLPFLLAIVSIATALLFKNSEIANKILSSRPIHWNVYIEQFGKIFNLFGNEYPAYIRKLHPVDNSYIYILSILGMVTLILLLLVLYTGLRQYIKLDMKKNIVVVTIFLIYSFGENVLIDVALNFTLILVIRDIIMYNSNIVNIYKIAIEIAEKYRSRRR